MNAVCVFPTVTKQQLKNLPLVTSRVLFCVTYELFLFTILRQNSLMSFVVRRRMVGRGSPTDFVGVSINPHHLQTPD